MSSNRKDYYYMDKENWVHVKDFDLLYLKLKENPEELKKFYQMILSQMYFFPFTEENKKNPTVMKNFDEIKRFRNRLCKEMIKDYTMTVVKHIEEEFIDKTLDHMKELQRKADKEKETKEINKNEEV